MRTREVVEEGRKRGGEGRQPLDFARATSGMESTGYSACNTSHRCK